MILSKIKKLFQTTTKKVSSHGLLVQIACGSIMAVFFIIKSNLIGYLCWLGTKTSLSSKIEHITAQVPCSNLDSW